MKAGVAGGDRGVNLQQRRRHVAETPEMTAQPSMVVDPIERPRVVTEDAWGSRARMTPAVARPGSRFHACDWPPLSTRASDDRSSPAAWFG